MNKARHGRNSNSTVTSASIGMSAASANANRPASQMPERMTKGHPAKPRAPVQLATAVSRKPVMAAVMNPKSISCACQR